MSNERKPTSSVFRYARILSRPNTASVSAQAALEQQARPRTEPRSAGLQSGTSASSAEVSLKHEDKTAGQRKPGGSDTSANLRYEAEGPINAIDLVADGSRAAVAGREVLKIVTLGHDGIREEANLRDAHKVNLNYSSNDVKWGKGATSKMLAIATTNGSIVTWHADHDSGRRLDRVISGHSRAVNRLSFNPGNGSWLLSASQDGSMKLWDLRDREHGARFVLKGRAEAVRDIQFNASNALELAAVFDNGTLQKWDLRQPSMYERKLNAHQGLALAIDWHPDGRHVATGGRDKVIKVWDIGSENQRKPVAFVHTLAPVSRVAWRPGDVRKTFEIASCSFSMENVVRLWNLRRPYVASRVFETHEAVATGIAWRNEDTLVTCSKDRHIYQHAIYSGAAPVDHLSHYSFSWNGNDDIAVTLGSRRSDKHRLEQVDRALDQQLRAQSDSFSAERRQKLVRTGNGPEFDSEQLAYTPIQSFAVIEPEDDSIELFRYLASHYSISSENPIFSCTYNAGIAKRAQQEHIEKSWNLLKLALMQFQRRQRFSQLREKKIKTSFSHQRESLVHKHLERVRHPLTESGLSTVRAQSPANSFILPKYQDAQAVPASPLSHAIATLPARPPTATSFGGRSSVSQRSDVSPPSISLEPVNAAKSSSTDSESVSPRQSISPPIPSDSLDSTGSETNAWGEAAARYSNSGHFGSFESSTESAPSNAEKITQSGEVTPLAKMKSPKLASPQPQGASEPQFENHYDPSDDRPWALKQLASRILSYYRDVGDVQMCSTLCLVLGRIVDMPESLIDEWQYCYLELLHRQRLFVQATQLVKSTSSDMVRAFSQRDTSIYTSCARCHKQIPLVCEVTGSVEEQGSAVGSTSELDGAIGAWAWTCPRCSNTVVCLVCQLVIRGHASWCHSCGHAMHMTCREQLDEDPDMTGDCVAPNCHCHCRL
jgi:WD40 repeat protein